MSSTSNRVTPQDLPDQPGRPGAVLRILCFSTKSVIGAPVHSFGLIWEIFRHIRRASQLHANRLRSTKGAAVRSLALAIVRKFGTRTQAAKKSRQVVGPA